MNREFSSMNSFNEFLQRRLQDAAVEKSELYEGGLKKAVEFLKEKAKDMFGHYPPDNAWPQLSPVTQQLRTQAGYSPNDPLLVTGKLKESVETHIEGRTAIVGSKDPIMLYQEKGTRRTGWSEKGIPPRPVFLLVEHKHAHEAVEIFFKSFVKSLNGLKE